MFRPDYYKEYDIYKIKIFHKSIMIAEIESTEFDEVFETFTKIEEQYYSYKFSKDEKELKYKNAKYSILLKENYKEDLIEELTKVNIQLQKIYDKNGFSKIRLEHEAECSVMYNEGLNKELGGGGENGKNF